MTIRWHYIFLFMHNSIIVRIKSHLIILVYRSRERILIREKPHHIIIVHSSHESTIQRRNPWTVLGRNQRKIQKKKSVVDSSEMKPVDSSAMKPGDSSEMKAVVCSGMKSHLVRVHVATRRNVHQAVVFARALYYAMDNQYNFHVPVQLIRGW